MPKYSYTAKSLKGEPETGVQEAQDQSELARALRQQGFVLISAAPEETKKREKQEVTLPFFSAVSLKDKLMLARNLRVMIGAGVSLPKALQTLSQQTKNKKLKKILFEIAQEIVKGKSFSDSLKKYPNVFSELFCNMIKVGEESGTIEKNLGILAGQMEREYQLKSKIKGAMVYPAVIIAAMVGIGILMLIMVVPQLAATFQELEIELPLTTKIVIGLSLFLVGKWYLLIFIIIALSFLVKPVFKTKEGRKIIAGLTLKIPVVSQIVKKTNAAYTVRTLASLISAGIPLVRSLEIISKTLDNFYFQQAVKTALEKVKKGEKLSQSLKPYQDLYPLTVIQMIEVGEETGQTSNILEKLGDFFEEEVTAAAKNLAAVIEPVLMLIIGGVVGFFAISMIQPMYSMLQGI